MKKDNEKEKRDCKKKEKRKDPKWNGDDALIQRQTQRVIKRIQDAVRKQG